MQTANKKWHISSFAAIKKDREKIIAIFFIK
jgi:hypothetical protein